jgi:hypothetical protein
MKSAATKRRKRPKRKPRRARELGITDEEYTALLTAQDGGCAICGNPPKTRRLHVDHNHRTGKVRGLLCFRCNRQLSTYVTSKWLRAALEYVLRDEEQGDVPDQWADVPDQWEAAR